MESIIKVDYQDAVPGKNVYAVKLKKNGELELYTESEEYIKKQAALETAVKKATLPHIESECFWAVLYELYWSEK